MYGHSIMSARRAISRRVVGAFVEGRKDQLGNTKTDGIHLWLHGNQIARRIEMPGGVNVYLFSLCGWDTVTTRERLNAIPGLSVRRIHGVPHANDTPIDEHKTYRLNPDGSVEPVE